MTVVPSDQLQDKRFARRLSTMIEAGLIDCRHFARWVDEMILASGKPPFWLLEIASIKYSPDAVAAINRFVFSEPFQDFSSTNDDYLACLFLRHQRGEIAWATFLDLAGHYCDQAAEAPFNC